jgi:hypothetical protein
MSGGDDFRTQYRDWGIGEPPEPPEEAPEHAILRLARQYGVRKVEVWVKQAAEKIEAETRNRKAEERRREIERLKEVAAEGEEAKRRLQKLEAESG